MTEPTEAQVDGCKLTTVTINAASPDVVGSLMKQITEAVLKAIPEGTLEKIASEIIKNGEIVRYVNNGYRSEDVRYVLSEEAKKKMIGLIDKEIQRQVESYLKEAEVKTLIANAVCEGVAAGISHVPQRAANVVADRICGGMGMSHGMETPAHLVPVLSSIESLRKTQQALITKGVISFGDTNV